jgi:hypothetical protein
MGHTSSTSTTQVVTAAFWFGRTMLTGRAPAWTLACPLSATTRAGGRPPGIVHCERNHDLVKLEYACI